MVSLPEQSNHTSIKERVDHVVEQGRLEDVNQIRQGSVPAQQVSEGIEDDHWLVPIEDRRRHGAKRAGMKEGFTLGQYLMLVDCTCRMVRDGKVQLSREALAIFDRLEIEVENWLARMKKLLTRNRIVGSFMASTREALRTVAKKLGVRHLVNTA